MTAPGKASVNIPNRPAYRDANAIRWVLGYLSSLVGDQIWFIALGWAAVQTGSPEQVGLVLAAGSVPRAALLLFGGALADRWGLRRTAIVSDLVRTFLLLTAAATALLLPPAIAPLLLLAAAFGVVDAVFLPATAALPQQLASSDQMTRIQGMRSTAQRAATTFGAPLGGLLVALGGTFAAFAAAAGATALSVLALRATRVRAIKPPQQHPLLREVRTGLAYVGRHPVLLPLLLLATIFEFGSNAAMSVGLPILSESRGWGPSGLGLLLGAFGIGATASALTLVAVPRIPHAGRVFPPLIFLMAASLMGIGTATSLHLATLCAALVGVGAGLAGSMYGSLVLTESAPDMVARVTSLSTLASLGLAPIGYTLAGIVAGTFGPTAPFVAAAALAILATIPGLAAPALRRAQLR